MGTANDGAADDDKGAVNGGAAGDGEGSVKGRALGEGKGPVNCGTAGNGEGAVNDGLAGDSVARPAGAETSSGDHWLGTSPWPGLAPKLKRSTTAPDYCGELPPCHLISATLSAYPRCQTRNSTSPCEVSETYLRNNIR